MAVKGTFKGSEPSCQMFKSRNRNFRKWKLVLSCHRAPHTESEALPRIFPLSTFFHLSTCLAWLETASQAFGQEFMPRVSPGELPAQHSDCDQVVHVHSGGLLEYLVGAGVCVFREGFFSPFGNQTLQEQATPAMQPATSNDPFDFRLGKVASKRKPTRLGSPY